MTVKKKPVKKAVKQRTFTELRKEYMNALETLPDAELLDYVQWNDIPNQVAHFADVLSQTYDKEKESRKPAIAKALLSMSKAHGISLVEVEELLCNYGSTSIEAFSKGEL